jgi:deoxyhypusine synthase
MMELQLVYESRAENSNRIFRSAAALPVTFRFVWSPLHQDLKRDHVPLWAYFARSATQPPAMVRIQARCRTKITWGKLGKDTPRFIIGPMRAIVAPLMFAYVLGW